MRRLFALIYDLNIYHKKWTKSISSVFNLQIYNMFRYVQVVINKHFRSNIMQMKSLVLIQHENVFDMQTNTANNSIYLSTVNICYTVKYIKFRSDIRECSGQ